MELDILAGVHKEIQVTVNGQLQPHYIKAIHYYMPWYFNREDIKIYTDAAGNNDSGIEISNVDMFAYNTLRDVFAPTGLNAMKNEFVFWYENYD